MKNRWRPQLSEFEKQFLKYIGDNISPCFPLLDFPGVFAVVVPVVVAWRFVGEGVLVVVVPELPEKLMYEPELFVNVVYVPELFVKVLVDEPEPLVGEAE